MQSPPYSFAGDLNEHPGRSSAGGPPHSLMEQNGCCFIKSGHDTQDGQFKKEDICYLPLYKLVTAVAAFWKGTQRDRPCCWHTRSVKSISKESPSILCWFFFSPSLKSRYYNYHLGKVKSNCPEKQNENIEAWLAWVSIQVTDLLLVLLSKNIKGSEDQHSKKQRPIFWYIFLKRQQIITLQEECSEIGPLSL